MMHGIITFCVRYKAALDPMSFGAFCESAYYRLEGEARALVNICRLDTEVRGASVDSGPETWQVLQCMRGGLLEGI